MTTKQADKMIALLNDIHITTLAIFNGFELLVTKSEKKQSKPRGVSAVRCLICNSSLDSPEERHRGECEMCNNPDSWKGS